MTNVHPEKDWSGKPFAVPGPVAFTKSWRIKQGFRNSLTDGATATLAGQDSISAAGCTAGLPVYAGYYDGFFANLSSFRTLFPSAIILSITPDGAKGARCIDCEPGDATVAGAAAFVAANLPDAGAGGRNDGGLPMVYCSAGDAQAVINAVSALGITRNQWTLWTAHWIGIHICAPGTCGYPAADATQYMDGTSADYDLFYSYCFGTVTPPANPSFPLKSGDVDATATGPVHTLQKNINKWITTLASFFGTSVLLAEDGDFGPLTAAAVTVAQVFFAERGVPAGTCDQALFNDLAATPVSPWPLKTGSTGGIVILLQQSLVKWGFASSNQKLFPIDGDFGPLTTAAVVKAQAYFGDKGTAGTCGQALYADLAAAAPANPDAAVKLSQVVTMLTVMASKTGDPYTEEVPQRFGPGQFDCSGLVWYAANQAGIQMPGGPDNDGAALVPFEMEWAGSLAGAVLITAVSEVQAGDLIAFTGAAPAPFAVTIQGHSFPAGEFGHIGMAVSATEYISAYDTQLGVAVRPVSGDVFNCAVRMQGNAAPQPPPPPAPWGFEAPVALKLLGAGPHSVKFEFTANAQPHAGLAKFEVVICKGDKLGPVIATYPRYVTFTATGVYGAQYGGVEPGTGYTLGVRGMEADGSHSSEWVLLHFQTAA